MKKLMSILLTFAMLAMMMAPVFAVPGGFDPADKPFGEDGQALANKVLGVVQWVGYAFAFGMLLYIGIKYTMSAANEKADLKKGLINYVIGAGILFGASTIIGALENFI